MPATQNFPTTGLAGALAALKARQDEGRKIIRSADLTRRQLEHLTRAGYLTQIVKGWYIPSSPGDKDGDSTPWVASMISFVSGYANERFGETWHVSPETSLLLHAGNTIAQRQTIIYSPQASNNTLSLPFGTSLVDLKAKLLAPPIDGTQDMRLMPLPYALMHVSPHFFLSHPIDAQVALGKIKDSSELLHPLLEGGHTYIAERLAGAMRAIGREEVANEITEAFKNSGKFPNESNPFERPQASTSLDYRQSPYANRMRLMWAQMRDSIIDVFDGLAPSQMGPEAYMQDMQEQYVADAYHSMSIEGYRVTEELILKVALQNWNPQEDNSDSQDRDAMAARGYYDCFQLVKDSVSSIMNGEDSGSVARRDHRKWYSALFGPSVQAGILAPHHLAGYRAHQVFIRNSMHTPLPVEAVRDCMPVLFDLLEQESHSSVRAVLGHFLFGFIHPYMDGNGRIARFLMNTQLANAGYPWTIIRLEDRSTYMSSLEAASSNSDIKPFAQFVRDSVATTISEKPS